MHVSHARYYYRENENNSQVYDEESHDEEALEDDNPTSPIANDYFDPNDPALYVGKHPLSDDDKLTLLTSKFNCPSNFVFPTTSGRNLM